MLTRLEVDGFKNLLDVSVDLGPFNCIAGENGVGKSNLFDAIEFLSLLATDTLSDAARKLRSTDDERSGDPRDLFWDLKEGGTGTIRMAAEMIVPARNVDDFGEVSEPSITFLRYEVEIGYLPPGPSEFGGRLELRREKLSHINKTNAVRHLTFPLSRDFVDSVVMGRRTGGPFIDTEEQDGQPVMKIFQDAGRRGRPLKTNRASRTIVSTVTSSEFPTVFAVRQELRSWRRLALEPSALRSADDFGDSSALGSDGRHLPAVLNRIANGQSVDPTRIYGSIASRLSGLAGIDVRDLSVDADHVRQKLSVMVHLFSGVQLPARSLSEGTLRFLALCVLLEDDAAQGVICMEEPENGIHPANLPRMVELLRDLAFDASYAIEPGNPFRQIIVNTHSPAVVQLVGEDDLIFATHGLTRRGPVGRRSLQLRPMANTWRWRALQQRAVDATPMTKADILPYLTEPPGAPLSLRDAGEVAGGA